MDTLQRHRRASGLPALPQGPSLRSGLCCPSPSSLTRPHPPHSPTRRNFPALRVICDAFAVLVHPTSLACPRAVPSFRVPFLPNLSPSYVPGESIDCFHPVFVDGVRLRPALRSDSALSTAPLQSASCGTLFFGASWFAHLVRPAELLASLADRTDVAIGLQRLLLPSFRSSRSPSSPSDMTTVASGYLHRQHLHLLEQLLASLH